MKTLVPLYASWSSQELTLLDSATEEAELVSSAMVLREMSLL